MRNFQLAELPTDDDFLYYSQWPGRVYSLLLFFLSNTLLNNDLRRELSHRHHDNFFRGYNSVRPYYETGRVWL